MVEGRHRLVVRRTRLTVADDTLASTKTCLTHRRWRRNAMSGRASLLPVAAELARHVLGANNIECAPSQPY